MANDNRTCFECNEGATESETKLTYMLEKDRIASARIFRNYDKTNYLLAKERVKLLTTATGYEEAILITICKTDKDFG